MSWGLLFFKVVTWGGALAFILFAVAISVDKDPVYSNRETRAILVFVFSVMACVMAYWAGRLAQI